MPSLSAFRTLYESNNDQALITATGFDHATFSWILEKFKVLYDSLTPFFKIRTDNTSNDKRGRPRDLDAIGCLGLVLVWTRTKGSYFPLCMMFGIMQSTCSVFLRFGRRILCHVLSKETDSQVKLPTNEVVLNEFCTAVARRHPTLGEENVCFACDGLKLLLEQAGDTTIQNMFYNGWTHNHYITNVFGFAPNGTIVSMCINAPGSMHDSQLAQFGYIYDNLDDMYNRYGVKCCVDSAFFASKNDSLIQSAQTCPVGNARTVRMFNEATSFRQTSEWGMRGLQGSFPRLKDRLVYEECGERLIIIKMIVMLFNLRSNRVGINQILNTYMPRLESDAHDLLMPFN